MSRVESSGEPTFNRRGFGSGMAQTLDLPAPRRYCPLGEVALGNRLFVAIEVPAGVRESLTQFQGELRGARWVRAEQIHLTLRFIGEVEEDVARRIEEALARVRQGTFPLAGSGGGVFPSLRSPRVLWAGFQPQPALAILKDAIDGEIEVPDPESRRPFHPHLTLARLRDPDRRQVEALLSKLGSWSTPEFTADRFVLFQSELGRDGAKHTVLRSYELEA